VREEFFECSGIVTVDHSESMRYREVEDRSGDATSSTTTVYDETQLDSLCLRLAVASQYYTTLHHNAS